MTAPSITQVVAYNGLIIGTLSPDNAGTLYGVADDAGNTNADTLFEVSLASQTATVLATLDYGTTGAGFTGGLIADAAGNLYGTTIYGGLNGSGVLFEIAAGTQTLMALASSADGSPGGPPVIDSLGNAFFTVGGTAIDEVVAGSGIISPFVSIDANSSLTIDAAGNIYGTTRGGDLGYGSVFEIAAGTSTVTTLATFDYSNGALPETGLVIDAAGNLYGNAHNLFMISAATHTYSVLATFSDGGTAEVGNQIAVTADGTVYGTTTAGDGGTVYELAAGTHSVTTLLSDAHGVGDLIADSAGNLYGAEAASTGRIFEIVPCYCPGTLIATEQGERRVETLAIGDRVMTLGGAACAIRWIGRRAYGGSFIAGRHLLLPVCVKAGAIGPGKPFADLWVSPGHGLFVKGQLIPAWRLINGVSIVQAQAVESVTYIHVELDRHDIIIANGLPAESFLDDHCRNQFHNATAFHQLYPDARPMAAFAPRLEAGFALERIQQAIGARAGLTARWPRTRGPLRGYIDIIEAGRVSGWAQDLQHPEEPVSLVILIDGRRATYALANGYRPDLRQAGIGSGCHAFTAALPPGLQGVVEVHRANDGAALRPVESVTASIAA